jgi:uncharacterized protein (DUF1499 family)
MKRASMLIAILAIVAVIALFVLGKVSETGQASGIVDGRLTRCPEKPNCVCSEYRKDDRHFVEPLELTDQSAESGAATVRAIIIELGGEIKSERADYIAATFTSPLFRFADDLEIRIDKDVALIHFRSASRVGHGDLGANLKRVELIQARFRQSHADN